MGHIKALDGVRGLAILLVVLFHFGVLGWGWAGVQLFFVLSGYLITSILLREKSTPLPHYLGRFYWRRALRILPIFTACVAGLTVLFCCSPWLQRTCPTFLQRDLWYIVTSTTNVGRALGDLPPIYSHFWSLALEEQFYLLWPLVVWLLPARPLKGVLLALLALCPLLRFLTPVLLHGSPFSSPGITVYVLPTSQFDAFAVGAALAVFGPGCVRDASRALVLAAGGTLLLGYAGIQGLGLGWGAFLPALGFAVPLYGNGYQHVWGYTCINVVCGLLILAALRGERWTALLEHRYLVAIGRISYGMYVIHIPLLLGLWHWLGQGSGWGKLGLFLLYFPALVALSWLSYTFFEARFLALKDTRFTFSRAQENPRTPAAGAPVG